MYKSDKVALVVCGLGVASLVGAVIWSACEEPQAEESAEAQPYVSTGESYAHNTHVPNAGWFHAPTRTFEPYPYNYYEAGRGHYYGGGWHPEAAAAVPPATSATPTPESATKANTAIARANASSSTAKGSYSRSSGAGSSSSRGGFGSSGGHGGS